MKSSIFLTPLHLAWWFKPSQLKEMDSYSKNCSLVGKTVRISGSEKRKQEHMKLRFLFNYPQFLYGYNFFFMSLFFWSLDTLTDIKCLISSFTWTTVILGLPVSDERPKFKNLVTLFYGYTKHWTPHNEYVLHIYIPIHIYFVLKHFEQWIPFFIEKL